ARPAVPSRPAESAAPAERAPAESAAPVERVPAEPVDNVPADSMETPSPNRPIEDRPSRWWQHNWLIELAWLAGALVFTALVTGYRISVARGARFPGHADPAFAYGVAQNIHAGRG